MFTFPSLQSVRSAIVLSLLIAVVVSSSFAFVLVPKRATALLGIADVSFTTIVANIPELAIQILSNFIYKFLMKLLEKAMAFVVAKIQKNFMIKNFLQYAAVLSNNKYVEDYLNKYISSPDARSIIRASIKSINQGGLGVSPPLLRRLQADADRYRGFRTADLTPNSPDYLEKLAKQADLWSSSIGWYYAYVDQGFKAKSEADRATALNIVTGAGYKSGYNKTGGSVVTVPAEIDHLVQERIGALMDALGSKGGGSITSAIANFVANFAVASLNSIIDKPDTAVYDEDRDFPSVVNPGYPPTFTLVAPGGVEVEQTGRPLLPRVPDFCAAGQQGSVRTDLGTASATASGGSGTGSPPPSGGSATASVNLNNGRMSVGDNSLPCGGQFSQGEANRSIDMLDYNPDNPPSDRELQFGPRP